MPTTEDPADGDMSAFLNTNVPNVARIYDYLLGGKDHFAADREAAEKIIQAVPDVQAGVRQNRDFLGRAVRYLVDAGIRQFIDIGTGLPTQGSVHEIAQEISPEARIVYVDHDPVVVAHAQALLANNTPRVAAIQGDLHQPAAILAAPELRALINFDEPVAVLLIAVAHFIADEKAPAALVRDLMDATAPGSYLVLSHVTADHVSSEADSKARSAYQAATASAITRTHAQVMPLFDGLEMVEPGLVDVGAWRTETQPGRTLFYGGMARKQ